MNARLIPWLVALLLLPPCPFTRGDEPADGVAEPAWVKQTQQLVQAAEAQLAQGQLDAAVRQGQQALDLCYQQADSPYAIVDTTAQWLLGILESEADFPRILQVQDQYVQWNRQKRGGDAWQTRDAEAQRDITRTFAKLPPKRLEQILAAEADDEGAFEWFGNFNNPTAALRLAERAKSTRVEILGNDHLLVGSSHESLAEIQSALGNLEAANTHCQEALRIYKLRFGDFHPSIGSLLTSLGDIARFEGRHAQARDLALQASQVTERTMGERAPQYIQTLIHYGMILQETDDFETAKAQLQRAFDLLATTPETSPQLQFLVVSNLADACLENRELDRAEKLYRRALELYDKHHFGDGDAGNFLNRYANFFISVGNLPEAIRYYEQALALVAEQLGTDTIDYAIELGNLASMHATLGNTAKAKRYADQLNSLVPKLENIRADQLAGLLGDLATVYGQIGEHSRAFDLYGQIPPLMAEIWGTESRQYASAMVDMAQMYVGSEAFEQTPGAYAHILEIYQNALRVYQSIRGADDPQYANVLVAVADLHLYAEKWDLAEKAYLQAAEIYRASLGENSFAYARTLGGLYAVAWSRRDFVAAEQYLDSAMKVAKQTFGDEHPGVAEGQIYRALARLEQGKAEEAEPLARDALQNTLRYLDRSALVLTADQQLAMVRNLRYQFSVYLQCCGKLGRVPQAGEDLIVGWKGSVALRQRQLMAAALDPGVAEISARLTTTVQRLGNLAHARSLSDKPQIVDEQHAQLAQQKENTELELLRACQQLGIDPHAASATEIRQALPDDTVLVDFHQIRADFQERILAVLIQVDQPATVVDLGTAETLAPLLAKWRSTFGEGAQAKRAGEALRDQLWMPLMPHLGHHKRIFLSADGVVANVPFAALPSPQPDRYLIEDYQLHHISVPRLIPQLARANHRVHWDRTLLTVGGVDYDASTTDIAAALPSMDQPATDPVTPQGDADRFAAVFGAPAGNQLRGGEHWNRLANTQLECENISQLVRNATPQQRHTVVNLSGAAASETAFRQLARGNRIIHIATHGFFESQVAPPDSLKAPPSPEDYQQLFAGQRSWAGQQPSDPGHRSGLVLAGVNHAAGKKHAAGEDLQPNTVREDGILTAAEVATLSLEHVQLVTMSACETALGKAEHGEGTLGLQRSFQLAGAESTITTLWSVDDHATRVLMQRFYQTLLQQNLSRAEALRSTQLWALKHPDQVFTENTSVRGDRRVAASPTPSPARLSPRYWAPFVLSGSWR